MRRRSLPQVVIPIPCHVDWNTMTRIDTEGRARFCDSCEQPVYDSASMTRDELLELIARHEGVRLPCMQLHRRPDGTIVTRDCFAPLLRVGRFLWLKIGLAAVAFWAWALGIRPLARYLSEPPNQADSTPTRGNLAIIQRDSVAPLSSEKSDSPRSRTNVTRGRALRKALPSKPHPAQHKLDD